MARSRREPSGGAARAVRGSLLHCIVGDLGPDVRTGSAGHRVLAGRAGTAAALGVGAGGIGQDLMYSLEWRDFASVFSILCLLIVVVLIFDQTSVLVRRYLRSLRGEC